MSYMGDWLSVDRLQGRNRPPHTTLPIAIEQTKFLNDVTATLTSNFQTLETIIASASNQQRIVEAKLYNEQSDEAYLALSRNIFFEIAELEKDIRNEVKSDLPSYNTQRLEMYSLVSKIFRSLRKALIILSETTQTKENQEALLKNKVAVLGLIQELITDVGNIIRKVDVNEGRQRIDRGRFMVTATPIEEDKPIVSKSLLHQNYTSHLETLLNEYRAYWAISESNPRPQL